MVKFRKTEIVKEKFYVTKKPKNIWDVNVDNIVISNLIKRKPNTKYMIGYLDEDIRPLDSTMPKISGYINTFKVEDKNNKLMFFHIDDEKLLEKHKAISTKFEDLKSIKLNTLPSL